MGNTYNRVYIWCCKYGENRYCERCANKKWCASKHTGLLNSCLGKLCQHPYLVVPLISAKVILISTRVSAHCQTILLAGIYISSIGIGNDYNCSAFWVSSNALCFPPAAEKCTCAAQEAANLPNFNAVHGDCETEHIDEMMDNWHPFNSHTGNVCHYIKTLSVIQNSISDYVPNFTSQYTDYKLLVSACKLQRCLLCRDWMMWSSCGIYPSCGICVIGISVSGNSVIIGKGDGFTWNHHLNHCWLIANWAFSWTIIKSPRYTGGDFMFLYRFVRRRHRRRPQILVHAITFEQLFGFLSFLARLLALTYRLTD